MLRLLQFLDQQLHLGRFLRIVHPPNIKPPHDLIQLRGILIISQQRHLAISLEIGSEPLVSLRARRISRQHTASLLAVGGLRVRLGVFP